ncbi:MAG: N-6 DNA methylase, partial [Kiritimatiellaeota bacterium]|nr:N-6 DNA methylase [Kiritimatiellota bacterium]
DTEAWREKWTKAFVVAYRHAITKSSELAEALAVTAKRLCNRLREILHYEDEVGEIRKLQKAFKEALIHDLDDDGFADMFAQTVTYGLFSLACRRTIPGMGTAFVKEDLTHYFTSPFLRDMLGVFLGLNPNDVGIDYDEMGVSDVTDLLNSPETHMEIVLADFNNKTQGEDPVIYFYEHFLTAYDKDQKVLRGEFYTPQPVVSYIVRSVHELLKTELGIEDGLASAITWGEMIKRNPEIKLPPLTDGPGEKEALSPNEFFVQILDPATGTATFLVEVIDIIHQHLSDKWRSEGMDEAERNKKWNEYVPQFLLPRLYGYELKMAPYAIAHMKIGLKLSETGYLFGSVEPTHIYLSNTLEPAGGQLPDIEFEALVNEAAAVNEAKLYKRFTVVIGNPPYSVSSQNKGAYIDGLMELYKQAVKSERNIQPLSDDYIKFIRFIHQVLQITGAGLFGVVSNHSYMTGLIHRGMREELLKRFDMKLLDLHGSFMKGECASVCKDDENIFDIRQGIAIALGLLDDHDRNQSFAAQHSELWGRRSEKYSVLDKATASTLNSEIFETNGPQFFLEPRQSENEEEYFLGMPLDEIFEVCKNGVQTGHDDFAVDLSLNSLRERVGEFFSPDISQDKLRDRYKLKKKSGWSFENEQRRAVSEGLNSDLFVPFFYRPFDVRWIYYSKRILKRPVKDVMRHMLFENIALVSCRQQVQPGFHHVFVTDTIGDGNAISLKSREWNTYCPLYLFDETSGTRRSNVRENAIEIFRETLREQSENLPTEELSPEHVFAYIYAILHCPSYRERYKELLAQGFPRIPLPAKGRFFISMSRIGKELINSHLQTEEELNVSVFEFDGSGNESVQPGYPKYVDRKILISAKNGFVSVPEHIWKFTIGGYQVCSKWLKDRRGRPLSKDDIIQYRKILVSLQKTLELMKSAEDEVIAAGGWQEMRSCACR